MFPFFHHTSIHRVYVCSEEKALSKRFILAAKRGTNNQPRNKFLNENILLTVINNVPWYLFFNGSTVSVG
jgi:hypothetical protein